MPHRRYTLSLNSEKNTWDLKHEETNRLVRSFKTKTDATKKGALEKAIGREGGSVVIRKAGGIFEEERRFTAR